ncbi:ATP-binding cassette domain-containing protein [uncultured Oscillibacter sp.]|uniref:ATP-binding cassette domain-containing protein n=1 Tax=uncultured Oscillibacter sp. TaxID=876091 RepID=UPI0025F8971D|nr:ABC transporter ATP-binding protein [uncultured Oscillibacter sp.]
MTVEIRDVSKSYGGVKVLKSVNLTLLPGITCLSAPSGAGKTTLVRILLGLEQPDGGFVTGLETARLAAVFQEDRLLDRLDAAGNLRFVLGKGYDEKQAAALLGELGLADAGDKAAGEYSGGMKRRLALARALSVPFEFLALDEPFTGLDGENRKRALACIRRRAVGKTVLVVTHNSEDAAGLDAKTVDLE